MASNDGKKLTVFGLTFTQWDNRQMQHILRHHQRLPENPTNRGALFVNLSSLARDIKEGEAKSIEDWLKAGVGLPPRPAPPILTPADIATLMEGPSNLGGRLDNGAWDSDEDGDDEDGFGYGNQYSYGSRFMSRGRVLGKDGGEEADTAVVEAEEGQEMEGIDDAERTEKADDAEGAVEDTNSDEEQSDGEADQEDLAGRLEILNRQYEDMLDQMELDALRAEEGQGSDSDIGAGADAFFSPQSPIGDGHEHEETGEASDSVTPALPSNLIECYICYEPLEPSTFAPIKITDSCDHLYSKRCCLECLSCVIAAAIEEGDLTLLRCPLCPEMLSYDNVKEYGTEEIFERYDYLVFTSNPDVIMCLAPNCGKGQIHEGDSPIMICNSCELKTCVVHRLPWHEGFTCDEFDKDESQLERLENDEATAKLLAGTSMVCFQCKQGVMKAAGCDHMQCRCGNAWCFQCGASWENIMRIGDTAHGPACPYNPNKVQLRADKIAANHNSMTELVHGRPISEALEQARKESVEKRRAAMRPLAAAAAEARMKANQVEKKEVPKKSKVKLAPAWREGGRYD